MARFPHLMQRHHKWFVRMIVPADVQSVLGKTVLSAPTGESDQIRAFAVAAPIIARFKAEIDAARRTGRVSDDLTADEVAARYRAEKTLGSGETTPAEIEDVVRFALTRKIHQG